MYRRFLSIALTVRSKQEMTSGIQRMVIKSRNLDCTSDVIRWMRRPVSDEMLSPTKLSTCSTILPRTSDFLRRLRHELETAGYYLAERWLPCTVRYAPIFLGCCKCFHQTGYTVKFFQKSPCKSTNNRPEASSVGPVRAPILVGDNWTNLHSGGSMRGPHLLERA